MSHGNAKLKGRGLQVNLVNKSTVSVVDPNIMSKLAVAPFVLVVEGWNVKSRLGSRFGSYLLQAGFKGRYNHLGTHREGAGGLWQQMGYQGLDSKGITAAIGALAEPRDCGWPWSGLVHEQSDGHRFGRRHQAPATM